MDDVVRVVALVSGRVQGVGFRDWVRRVARPLGLAGSATNQRDGRVEVVAEGPRAAVEELLAALRRDESPGFVGGIVESWPPVADAPPGFRIG
jgi:acylphosphatase